MNEADVVSTIESLPRTRRHLFLSYARDQGPAGSALVIAWTLASFALAALLVLFVMAQVMYSDGGARSIALAVFVVALLWLLSIVEGSELAVARLLGSDPNRLAVPSAGRTLESVQRDPKAFFNGRQALVVTSIVAMTLSVAEIARFHHTPRGAGHGFVVFLGSWFPHAALVFGFPNFMVLWISQLYPKLRAASDPSGRFMLASYQSVVRGCMRLEKSTRLGAPTTVLGIIKDRVLLTGAAPEAVAMNTGTPLSTDATRSPEDCSTPP